MAILISISGIIILSQLIIKDLKSSLEDELKYNYFISLYNLFLSLDDEATLLDYQSLKKISLDEIQNLEDSLILVQSLDSLLRLIRDFDNIKIMFNNESKICYTNKYDLNSKIEILVNPIMDKVNFSKYKTIVLYDSLWINKSFVVEEDKKEKFLKLKKTINNSNKDASLYIPERKDFVVLYRYLAMLSSLKQKSIAMASLIKESSKSVNTNVFKILLLLDIFMELGLIQYKYEDEKVFFNIISNKKTSLEDSKILQRIRKLNHYFIENQ